MLHVVSRAERARLTSCLDVEMTASTTLTGHWDCIVRVVDPTSPANYALPAITPDDLGRELENLSVLHGGMTSPLPVYFAKAEPQVLAQFRALVG